MPAFYNENDAFAANWLENLSTHGHIAQGAVDRRSIVDLTAADVAGPGQRHFFAGIGGWSHALRLAGVPDDADVWTGSCPCQGLSDAGQKRGFLDPRHLWPAWFSLIRECRPPIIFGEQVASQLGLEWLDLVSSDLERCGYTVGAADLCAAGVGAPHIRQRLYFVAYAHSEPRRLQLRPRGPGPEDAQARGRGEDGGVVDTHHVERERPKKARRKARRGAEHGSHPGIMANPGSQGPQDRRDGRPTLDGGSAGALGDTGGHGDRQHARELRGHETEHAERSPDGRHPPITAGATRGFWAGCEWVWCRDGVWRPIESGTFPLSHGVSGRVGLLRGYGNAIVPEKAAVFIRSAVEAISLLATGNADVHDGDHGDPR